MQEWSPVKIIGVAGRAGSGKDTRYEHVLKPRGFLRWHMTLHDKIWLVSTGRVIWEEVFSRKSALFIGGSASEATEQIGTSRITYERIPLTVCPSIQCKPSPSIRRVIPGQWPGSLTFPPLPS
jgi:hypothetical protein